MEKTIGAFEVRRQFGRVLNDILARGDSYVVERHGEAVAVVVPISVYEQWKRGREAFFDQMGAAAERAGMGEQEAATLVDKAVEDARVGRHQRR